MDFARTVVARVELRCLHHRLTHKHTAAGGGTHMCTGGEYPGLLCPLVSRWSSVPLSSSWADCNRDGGLPLSVPGGLPPKSPGGLPPVRPDGSPPRRPWQLPPIGPVEPLFMRPGVPSRGREVSARAACEGQNFKLLKLPVERWRRDIYRGVTRLG